MPGPLTDIQHGGQYWAVLWVEEVGDPELEPVREAIDQRWGPVWSDGGLGCDRGAAEALDADPTARRVAVYFSTEADARQFTEQAALSSEAAGYTQVTTYCLDWSGPDRPWGPDRTNEEFLERPEGGPHAGASPR